MGAMTTVNEVAQSVLCAASLLGLPPLTVMRVSLRGASIRAEVAFDAAGIRCGASHEWPLVELDKSGVSLDYLVRHWLVIAIMHSRPLKRRPPRAWPRSFPTPSFDVMVV